MSKRNCFSILFSLTLLSGIMAQERAPHGLAYQNPMAVSPTTYDFFHPNARQDPCTSSHCAPFPLAAHVQETQSETEAATASPGVGLTFGAGSIAGPAFAAIIILCMAMGVYYIAKTRQANVSRTKAAQPDV